MYNEQTPHELLPKLFGELRERYLNRPGGYTRVLRTEPKDTYSQAPSAILQLVDGPNDMRFAMTAAAIARDRMLGKPHTQITRKNITKLTQFRADGTAELESLVEKINQWKLDEQSEVKADTAAFEQKIARGVEQGKTGTAKPAKAI